MKTLLDGFCPEPGVDEQLAFKCNGQMLFVCVSDIEWLEAADHGVALHLGRSTRRLSDSFPAVAARLPTSRFMAISRSALVNTEHVQGLQRLIFGEYEVVLRSGRRLPLAQGYGGPLLPGDGTYL